MIGGGSVLVYSFIGVYPQALVNIEHAVKFISAHFDLDVSYGLDQFFTFFRDASSTEINVGGQNSYQR